MNIFFIGDISGSPGRTAVKVALPEIKKKEKLDFVIANAENAAGGSGITPDIAEELFGYGVDVITSGDHIWKKKEVIDLLDRDKRILRPLNYPEEAPGSGWTVVESESGEKVGVINLVGRVFMQAVECPFKTSKKAVDKIRKTTPVIIVDMHAEATSEKVALGWYLDGEVSAIVGTHTHVQTADEKILPEGTAYITDCGMTGPFDSVIGRKKEQILARFITQMPARFEMAKDDVQLHGVVIDIDEKTGKAISIKRLERKL